MPWFWGVSLWVIVVAAAVQWISGARFTEDEYNQAHAAQASQAAKEGARLAALKANESLPLVYLDVSIKGVLRGRIEMVLFSDVSPRAAENFRRMCTGEMGLVPEGRQGAGKAYHFKVVLFISF